MPTLQLLEHVEDVFNLIKKAFLKKDIHVLGEVHELHQKHFFVTGYDVLRATNGDSTVVAHHLLSALRQFYQANSPLSGYLM